MSTFYSRPLRSDELYHYGRSKLNGAPGPGSGRYPLGSGKRKFQSYINTVKSTASPGIVKLGTKAKETIETAKKTASPGIRDAKKSIQNTIETAKKTASGETRDESFDKNRADDVRRVRKAQEKLDKYNERKFFKTKGGERRRQQQVNRWQGRLDTNDRIKRASRQADIADEKIMLDEFKYGEKELKKNIKSGQTDLKPLLAQTRQWQKDSLEKIRKYESTPFTHFTDIEMDRIKRGKEYMNSRTINYYFDESTRVTGPEEAEFWREFGPALAKEQTKKKRR